MSNASKEEAEMTEEDTTVQEPSRRYGRLLAYTLAYALAALPGVFAAVQGRYAASRETVSKVNAEKGREVSQLQEWAKASRADLDAVAKSCEARTDKLREEVQRWQAETTRALLELANARRFRASTRAALEREPVVKSLPPARPALRKLPKFAPPSTSLEQTERRILP